MALNHIVPHEKVNSPEAGTHLNIVSLRSGLCIELLASHITTEV